MLHTAVRFQYTKLSQLNLYKIAPKAMGRKQGKTAQTPSSTFPCVSRTLPTQRIRHRRYPAGQWLRGERANAKYSLESIHAKEIPQIQQRNLTAYNEGRNCRANPHTSTESLTSLKLVTRNIRGVHGKGMQGWLWY